MTVVGALVHEVYRRRQQLALAMVHPFLQLVEVSYCQNSCEATRLQSF